VLENNEEENGTASDIVPSSEIAALGAIDRDGTGSPSIDNVAQEAKAPVKEGTLSYHDAVAAQEAARRYFWLFLLMVDLRIMEEHLV
jgi:hypothetical protein